MQEQEQRRALDLAQMNALAELLRITIAEMVFDSDRIHFRVKLGDVERVAIKALNSRQLDLDQATELFVKAAARGYIKQLLESIRHPDDQIQ